MSKDKELVAEYQPTWMNQWCHWSPASLSSLSLCLNSIKVSTFLGVSRVREDVRESLGAQPGM